MAQGWPHDPIYQARVLPWSVAFWSQREEFSVMDVSPEGLVTKFPAESPLVVRGIKLPAEADRQIP